MACVVKIGYASFRIGPERDNQSWNIDKEDVTELRLSVCPAGAEGGEKRGRGMMSRALSSRDLG